MADHSSEIHVLSKNAQRNLFRTPRLYKEAAKILEIVEKQQASLKSSVFSSNHVNRPGLAAITCHIMQNRAELDYVIAATKLDQAANVNPYLMRVVLSEYLYRGKTCTSQSKSVHVVRDNHEALKKALAEYRSTAKEAPDKKPLSAAVHVPRYARVNLLVTTLEDVSFLLLADGFVELSYDPKIEYEDYIELVKNLREEQFLVDLHVENLLVFHPITVFYGHHLYRSGKLLLQDKASCLPAMILNPPMNSVVLDACAAPGMKTTHLSAIMQNTGKVLAIDKDPQRMDMMRDIVWMAGCGNVSLEQQDFLAVDVSKSPYCQVEYIMLDPSCSGSGIVKRAAISDAVAVDENNKRLGPLVTFQQKALLKAFSFPVVRRVVYSTCSIHSWENEQVVSRALESVGDTFQLVDASERHGLPFLDESIQGFPDVQTKCLRLRSRKDLTNGFFVAVFELRPDAKPRPKPDEAGGEAGDAKDNLEEESGENGLPPKHTDSKKRRRMEKKLKQRAKMAKQQQSGNAEPDVPEEAIDKEDIKKVKKENGLESNAQPDVPEKAIDKEDIKKLIKKVKKEKKLKSNAEPDVPEEDIEKDYIKKLLQKAKKEQELKSNAEPDVPVEAIDDQDIKSPGVAGRKKRRSSESRKDVQRTEDGDGIAMSPRTPKNKKKNQAAQSKDDKDSTETVKRLSSGIAKPEVPVEVIDDQDVKSPGVAGRKERRRSKNGKNVRNALEDDEKDVSVSPSTPKKQKRNQAGKSVDDTETVKRLSSGNVEPVEAIDDQHVKSPGVAGRKKRRSSKTGKDVQRAADGDGIAMSPQTPKNKKKNQAAQAKDDKDSTETAKRLSSGIAKPEVPVEVIDDQDVKSPGRKKRRRSKTDKNVQEAPGDDENEVTISPPSKKRKRTQPEDSKDNTEKSPASPERTARVVMSPPTTRRKKKKNQAGQSEDAEGNTATSLASPERAARVVMSPPMTRRKKRNQAVCSEESKSGAEKPLSSPEKAKSPAKVSPKRTRSARRSEAAAMVVPKSSQRLRNGKSKA